jgi:hypothetical protein
VNTLSATFAVEITTIREGAAPVVTGVGAVPDDRISTVMVLPVISTTLPVPLYPKLVFATVRSRTVTVLPTVGRVPTEAPYVYTVFEPEIVGKVAVKNNWSSKSRNRIKAVDPVLVALPVDGILIVTDTGGSRAVTKPVPLNPVPLTVYPLTNAFVPTSKVPLKLLHG